MRAIWNATLHYTTLQVLINSVVPENLGQPELATLKFDANLNLTKEVVSDLTWWIPLDWKLPIKSPILPWQ